MAIGRAQAQAIADGFLDSLGVVDSDTRLPVVEAILAATADAFVASATGHLDKAGAVDSGELAQSLVFEVTRFGQRYELVVGYPVGSKAAAYFDYVNQGVRGTQSNAKAPTSPYQFKTNGVSKGMAANLLQWFRRGGRQASNVGKPRTGTLGVLEAKRSRLRDTVKQTDSLRSLAYAVGTKIKREGLRATHYFDSAVSETLNAELSDALAVALATEVRIQIRRSS